MTYPEAFPILGLQVSGNRSRADIHAHYIAALATLEAGDSASRAHRAYCLIVSINTSRAQSLQAHFSNADGTALFEYPENEQLSDAQRQALATRYWEKQSDLDPQSREVGILENHYVWITGQKPPLKEKKVS